MNPKARAETVKASMGKEASSALPEKEKDTFDATAVTNLESDKPDRRAGTEKANMGKEASSTLTIKNEQCEHAESKKTASQVEITLIAPSANPEIWSQLFGSVRYKLAPEETLIGTRETKNDILQSASPPSELTEQANVSEDEIILPSPSADLDIYRPAFGSIRFRPWVAQSDGIEVSGPSGERPSDEQTLTQYLICRSEFRVYNQPTQPLKFWS